MSISTNSRPKQKQKHQNTYAFKLREQPPHQLQDHTGLCASCQKKLVWRIQFGKFKPLSAPKKCVRCTQKTIRENYHTICKSCAQVAQCCEKCLHSLEPSAYSKKLSEVHDVSSIDNM